MLIDRIIGAFTFRRQVYAEVEHDPDFTTTAWILVAAVSFLNQIGTFAGTVSGDLVGGLFKWLIGALVATVFAVVGFAIAAYAVSWAGRTFFEADAPFEEMIRTMGLAYVWNVVGVIGVVAAFSKALSCVLTPAMCIAPILGLVSWLFAVKEALDLEWGQTIITVIIGWGVQLIISFIATAILGALGLTAGIIGGALGS